MCHVPTYPQLHIIFSLENNQHFKALILIGYMHICRLCNSMYEHVNVVVYTFIQDH